jgi:hypothetical protein
MSPELAGPVNVTAVAEPMMAPAGLNVGALMTVTSGPLMRVNEDEPVKE